MQIKDSTKFKISIVTLGLLGCFFGFMGSSLASDLSAKNIIFMNIKPLMGYGATSLGVLGIFLSYSENRIGAYLLIVSTVIGLFSITALFAGAAFFYLSSAIFSFRRTSSI